MTKLRLTALTEDLCTNIAKYRPVQNLYKTVPVVWRGSCLDVDGALSPDRGFDGQRQKAKTLVAFRTMDD